MSDNTDDIKGIDIHVDDQPEPSAACGCVATMNEALKPHNTALVVPLMGPPRCLVEGYQIQGGRGSKRAVKVFANYCPFCGSKYAREAGQ